MDRFDRVHGINGPIGAGDGPAVPGISLQFAVANDEPRLREKIRMAKHLFVVLSNCVEGGDEAEFNDWYTNTHLKDILTVPGYVSATRYKLASAQVMEADQLTYRYLALYEIETDDIAATAGALPADSDEVARAGWRISGNLDADGAKSWIFTPIASQTESV
ncbi:MAG TPA: hypothetical protein VMA77_28610 [Solirubrobacteraceae bacterium]|nr:hypothetical protein [Solirubrobacteraceae bacterium]